MVEFDREAVLIPLATFSPPLAMGVGARNIDAFSPDDHHRYEQQRRVGPFLKNNPPAVSNPRSCNPRQL